MRYLLLASILTLCPISHAVSLQQNCLKDLAALPDFLLANDPGAPVHLAQYGQPHFDLAMTQARQTITQADTEQACDAALKRYLKAWRKGHLTIKAVHQGGCETPLPSTSPKVKRLSEQTLYWSIPSFDYRHGKALAALLEEQAPKLAGITNWIVDVRGNGGGNDDSYAPLMPYLLSGDTNEVSVEFLATNANIRALDTLCQRLMNNDPGCIATVKPLLNKLKATPTGEYALWGEEPIAYLPSPAAPAHTPERVAILVDGGCASSCEQFLLRVKQSFKVKLVGRSSFGALDYSNIRSYALPSGQRELRYATSRSLRLPYQPVDLAGIAPDIFLPPPEDAKGQEREIVQVQRWLEGGSLQSDQQHQ